jgi:hypothetical protein
MSAGFIDYKEPETII